MKAEIHDIQEAHINERQELEQTQNELTRDLKLKYGACISYCWPGRKTLINIISIMNTICSAREGNIYCNNVQPASDFMLSHLNTDIIKIVAYFFCKGIGNENDLCALHLQIFHANIMLNKADEGENGFQVVMLRFNGVFTPNAFFRSRDDDVSRRPISFEILLHSVALMDPNSIQ